MRSHLFQAVLVCTYKMHMHMHFPLSPSLVVNLFCFSQFEEKFEESNSVEAPPGIPSTSGFNENPAVPMAIEETTRNEIEMQGQEDQRLCTDTNASQDFVSGIMKIVPEVDVSLDFTYLSNYPFFLISWYKRQGANQMCILLK